MGSPPTAGDRRLIEAAFPLRQVSLDSVHEKYVRHGHISTLHIWPARRPLAASRAALLATLLRDPGSEWARGKLLRRMAGSVVEVSNASGSQTREETKGGINRWGREAGTAEFLEEVREAFGGRPPRVLDPFAGGGAIPLEAMRLGCEAVASDLNPVAWFILRCTLHYPRILSGQQRTLPGFVFEDREFYKNFLRSQGIKRGRDQGGLSLSLAPDTKHPPTELPASLDWHIRAWSLDVLNRAKRRLAGRYPVYADFEPLRSRGRQAPQPQRETPYEPRPPQLLQPDAEGRVSTRSLNEEFNERYLQNGANPRWVAKPVVAYLWARTVPCVGCGAEVPLLKTRWLCKRGPRRVLLEMKQDKGGVTFGVESGVPEGSGNRGQRLEHDRRLSAGTMSRSGVTCPRCGVTMTMPELAVSGRAGGIGERMTAVVVDGQRGKEYRLPADEELRAARVSKEELGALFRDVPFGLPCEPTPRVGTLSIRSPRYGYTTWRHLFTDRQLLALGTLVREIRQCHARLGDYPAEWREAIVAYLSCILSKFADYSSAFCSWHNSGEKLRQTMARLALPMIWDFCEVNPLSERTGSFTGMTEWVARTTEHLVEASRSTTFPPEIMHQSAIESLHGPFDVICTDPPYYDAIAYSDLMDFFYVWLRRVAKGISPETDAAFCNPLGPKWDAKARDGELIDDPSRFGGSREASKRSYEDGMARAFSGCCRALRNDGRLVLVFASKSPDAWETLVVALIRAGFVVTGSWPVQTEMQARQRAISSAALSSSIWLVCKKRAEAARPGWDGAVLHKMQENIAKRLRDFWDAGIRGPDFVWAATGPALEVFSQHPVVKKAGTPGAVLTVDEFLRHVRRMVAAFMVNRLLSGTVGAGDELDDPTTYYLLHRKDFGLGAAPAGACILYAISCNLADSDLRGRLDLLSGGRRAAQETDSDTEASAPASGSEARLKPWNRRRANTLGKSSAGGAPPPLIDCAHKLMQLWKTGERLRVDGYLEDMNLWHNQLFHRVVQALTDLATAGSEERVILENIATHLGVRTVTPLQQPMAL